MLRKLLFLFIGLLTLVSCSETSGVNDVSSDEKLTSITLATWNLQTFFDPVTDGTEYTEFKKGGNWFEAKYSVRLERLCETIISLNADIFVLEEMENAKILQDISNQMAGKSWNNKKNWTYACFSKDGSESIGCAVLSKYPLHDVKIHRLDIRTQQSKQPSTRPLIQVTADVNDRQIIILANHWKSKSGGEVESEIWRDWQENLLGVKLEEIALTCGGETAVVACGDFNRNAQDFFCDFDRPESTAFESVNTFMRFSKNGHNDLFGVYSPWFYDTGKFTSKTGSYYFNDSWEYIDNIFVCGNVKVSNFRVVAENPLISEDGIPDAYKIYTGSGYSDHLPLICTLSF